MSHWQDLELEAEISRILAEVPEAVPHHLGAPYLTAYQLAIEVAQRRPDVLNELGVPLGGRGSGKRTSLAQYLARELSRRINLDPEYPIEGGFLSNWHLHDISFEKDGGIIHSSLTGTPYTLSMFRLREQSRLGG